MTLLALPAQADQKNVTYEFKLLSETERSADGTVGVVPITRANEVLATLVLTHKAVDEHEATLTVTPPFPLPATVVDKGVISFTFKAGPVAGSAAGFNYPLTINGEIQVANMDLEIEDGELSGSIQVNFAIGHGAACGLTMQGTDGNWSGQWSCGFGLGQTLFFAFTAIPFRVEPGHEHDKVSER